MPPKGSKHIAYKWTPEAERLILLNVLKGAEFQATRHFFNQVAEKIGGGVTAEAVSQRFYKLKKESEALTNGTATAGNGTTAAAPTPATPTPKKSRAAPGTSGRKRKTAGATNGDGSGNNGDEGDGSPTKRTKTAAAKKKVAAAAAAEEGADNEDEVVKHENDDGKSDTTVKTEPGENENADVAGDDD